MEADRADTINIKGGKMKKVSKPKTYDCPPILYTKIIEWLYLNEEGFDSVREWREAFVKFLRKEFRMEVINEPKKD